jgi:hypothetical protein
VGVAGLQCRQVGVQLGPPVVLYANQITYPAACTTLARMSQAKSCYCSSAASWACHSMVHWLPAALVHRQCNQQLPIVPYVAGTLTIAFYYYAIRTDTIAACTTS